MDTKFRYFSSRLLDLIKSNGFFIFVILLFVFESVWIALSALYPQAFDENFHFGLIKVYSHYWLPFLSKQPPNANAYGAVARDPSYLYHYLMSFPYRFLAIFIHSQTSQVISLRLIDIALFTAGLLLFKKVLTRVGLSHALSNIILLLFILIPIVPQLAAQVTYDDLLFPIVACVCLLAFNLIDEIKIHKPRFKTLMLLLTICISTSLVKYALLPIFMSIVLFLLVFIYLTYNHKYKQFWKSLVNDFKAQSIWVRSGLPILLTIALVLFIQRDGWNLIEYHSIEPNCDKVLSVKSCSAYSPWYVDYIWHKNLVAGLTSVNKNIFVYTGYWFYWMWYRLFFAVNGAASGFYNNPPLPLPSIAAVLVAVLALSTTLRWYSKIFKYNTYILLLLTISACYLTALFVKGYYSYTYTSYFENMNGRYLIPVLLPLAAFGALGIRRLLRHSETKKLIMTLVIVFLFLEGGGLLTFIVNGDSTWYWPNTTVNRVNKISHKILDHIVIKGKIQHKNN